MTRAFTPPVGIAGIRNAPAVFSSARVSTLPEFVSASMAGHELSGVNPGVHRAFATDFFRTMSRAGIGNPICRYFAVGDTHIPALGASFTVSPTSRASLGRITKASSQDAACLLRLLFAEASYEALNAGHGIHLSFVDDVLSLVFTEAALQAMGLQTALPGVLPIQIMGEASSGCQSRVAIPAGNPVFRQLKATEPDAETFASGNREGKS
ncbi:MAG: hypothetical protein COX62_05215 [Deltaproteobacteria bacterium CG_4_10_14_0_2_um_filter_43_8]|nr:MAG: hypothetical protein COV43_06475 [Deltaproteobacteria bacterium CG11_big_fil_rev_8_21_14_0_20_42_23]PJA20152.1 MAG: hypothetical protein COX62_05215 [Deltaproteobacteria bacterium CG_4_10_14_0_2_um_filter_43_8]PJC64071.1 MAG: hypothetical protein CO021_06170 [Deltaproteobacteria bacterium CG_4_9_14_0_2_um_filter_42_21]